MITRTQVLLGSIAIAALTLAIFAGWRERRRKRRTHFDGVGVVAWPTVQVLAVFVAAACAAFLLHP